MKSNQRKQCKSDGPFLTFNDVGVKSINLTYFYKISLPQTTDIQISIPQTSKWDQSFKTILYSQTIGTKKQTIHL